ncbi:MAG: envelope stress response membrane protein PspB [Proteobacteria bacterium]|nr:envelope stress response membrane protein PspB [Pseudomonadota bacterium]MCH8081153.1 envelope stress response membrane protein PspB [Pseudomonadota bacterium]MCH8172607.1 envelope stress response membrane protein PspB [Pseudomonadota bacterium]MCH8321716.1 envelope stress response membrane protein PspB [Pseudomonadota bacterium]
MLALTVVAPIAIIGHYVTKWKAMKQVTPKDEENMGSLRERAEKLEDRLESLERILDDEIPDWRRRTHDRL